MVMSGAPAGNEEQYIDSPIGLQWLLNGAIRIRGVNVLRNSTTGEAFAAIETSGIVGPQSLPEMDTANPFRFERQGSMGFSPVHGKFAEQSGRRQVFSACNPSAQATTAALATTYTGMCLTNPPNSGKNLILLKAHWLPTAVPTTFAQTGLMGGFGTVTHTAQLIVHSNLLDTPMTARDNYCVGIADSSATIPAPVLLQPMANANASNTLPVSMAPLQELAEGAWVIGPGSFIAIYTQLVGNGIGFMAWEETPL